MNSSLRRLIATVARGTVATGALALTSVIAPQMIMRSQSPPLNSGLVYASLVFGVAVLACVMAMTVWAGRLAPRRSSTRLAATYVGEGAGILISAARYLAFCLLAVLGSGLAAEGIDAMISLGSFFGWVTAVIIVASSIPTMKGTAIPWRLILGGILIGLMGLGVVLIFGLAHEVLSSDTSDALAETTRTYASMRPVQGRVIAQSLVIAVFPASVLALISERSIARSGKRRVSSSYLLRIVVLAVVAISITTYFTVTLHIALLGDAVPTLVLASAYLGRPGEIVVAASYVCLGTAVAVSAFWSLPRLVTELAIERLLPHYLASPDAHRPRVATVGLSALLCAVFSRYLTMTQAAAVIFVFAVFTMNFLIALTIVLRGRSVLKTSVDKDERGSARSSLYGFLAFMVLALAVVALVAVADLTWALFGSLALAVPAAILLFFRKGRVRAVQKLAPRDLTAGRKLPTRVHGVVLVTRLDMPALKALSYARAARLSTLTAVTLDFEADTTAVLRSEWEESAIPVNLTILGTPQGASVENIVEFVQSLRSLRPADVVMVFVPRVIATSMWHRFFIRHSTPRIISALRREEGVVVCEVPYQLAPEEAENDDDN